MTPQSIGFIVFAAVVALNAAGIAVDAALKEHGLRTISDFARDNAWAAVMIIAVNTVGLIGLCVHFSNGR